MRVETPSVYTAVHWSYSETQLRRPIDQSKMFLVVSSVRTDLPHSKRVVHFCQRSDLRSIGSPYIVIVWNVVFANESQKLGWIWMKLGRWG